MARVRASRDMVRILYYRDDRTRNSDSLNQMIGAIRGQVGGDQQHSPDIFFLSPDRRVLSFVDYKDYDDDLVAAQGNKALQIMQWYKGAQRSIASADRAAERGRYADAVETIDDVLEEDAKVSHLIQQLVGRAGADDPMPEEPVGTMFEGLREQKWAEYEAMAQARLEEAQALVAEEKLREAQRILRNLVRAPESFPSTPPAVELLEEVVEKLRG